MAVPAACWNFSRLRPVNSPLGLSSPERELPPHGPGTCCRWRCTAKYDPVCILRAQLAVTNACNLHPIPWLVFVQAWHAVGISCPHTGRQVRSARRCMLRSIESGFREMLSMPLDTSHSAKSG